MPDDADEHVHCFPSRSGRKMRPEPPHPFSFVSICDVLALDVAYVRSGLRHWRESRQVALPTELRTLQAAPDISYVSHAGGSGL
jgi:hypothetical protein